MDMDVPIHQISTWGENFNSDGNSTVSASMILKVDANLDNQLEDMSRGSPGPSNTYNQERSKHRDKVQRRLAQNREAARKSRLRKKAYVQQLEISRLKLIEMEHELDRARQQFQYRSGGLEASLKGFSGTVNTGITAFELEYGHWVEEEKKRVCELRLALNAHISDIELHILVENGMSRYLEFFRLKGTAARADAFYVMSGMWQTSAERFFLWIGGFRPSELLKVLVPRIEPLTDEQLMDVYDLRLSCQQAEDAISQGMDKLHQNLTETIAVGQLATAMERLEALASFVNQADHLRQETLKQMYRILTTRQAAQGLLALGEYFQFLRALSSYWATRPSEPAYSLVEKLTQPKICEKDSHSSHSVIS